ncbi:hypothetical protein QRB41_27835 [Mycobacterium avium subsp. hominissuis]|uniref:hypothetical protein n=1 Tax=Mycobacterium avium TaxID=1764 RepID=UPI00266510BD|nr:hypothetical protein [Mycobacterium avium]MDO2387117.1 hypothetical protein [Mycobacterium avium subsp. hominissuis]
MTGVGMPAWPATMAAFVLELAGIVPPLDPRVRNELAQNEESVELAQRLAEEPSLQDIVFSDADHPSLHTPTVLSFTAESWAQARSGLGIVERGQGERIAAIWHTAVPLVNGDYLLTPDPGHPEAVSFYRATRNDDEGAIDFRVGTASRGPYEVVWEDNDDRCHLRRFFNGLLQCKVVGCSEVCHRGIEVDPITGAQSFPCGCP